MCEVRLDEETIAFVRQQHVFFVATAAAEGRVNVSPKGLDTLRILSPERLAWLDLTGSGNETAAHLGIDPRITLMFCAFEGPPRITRVYGRGLTIRPRNPAFGDLLTHFPNLPGARQIIVVDVELVTRSCGEAVPCFEFRGQRSELISWATGLGPAGLEAYWRQRNAVSIDGFPTEPLTEAQLSHSSIASESVTQPAEVRERSGGGPVDQ
ncbi:MAG: pyridoxamine 5'-phosphate oxidase family protein [Thermoanaerobaculia bacterium]